MRRSSAILLTLVALTGCAAQHRPVGELAVAPVPRTITRVEVTNDFGRRMDVFYGTQFMGTLNAGAHASYTVPPSTERLPIYARFSGQSYRAVNISNGRTVRYVYEEPALARR